MTRHAKTIDLALQGGGSHGAFTWGVLERLLEDKRIRIEALSGTSAGAMNAVVFADGYASAGRAGAAAALGSFWDEIARAAGGFSMHITPYDALFHSASPLYKLYDVISRFVSPYQANPFNLNPLREILERHADFDRLRGFEGVKVFISATNVRTGHHRVFRNAELTLDAVLASACLPVLFQAVEVAGEAYWDGGYTSNPALLPLISESSPNDLVLVQINPVQRPGVPRTAQGIIDRINEISFNSSLNQELRTVALLKRLLEEEANSGHSYQAELFRKVDALCVHRIEAQKELGGLGASSKLNPGRGLVRRLHDIGYRAADEWLRRNYRYLGKRSTVDVLEEVEASV